MSMVWARAIELKGSSRPRKDEGFADTLHKMWWVLDQISRFESD